jgi:hypothetical protein
LLTPGVEVIPPQVRRSFVQATEKSPHPENAPTPAEYQQVAEHLVTLNFHLEVLERSPNLPRRVDRGGVPRAPRHVKGIPISFRACWESTTVDELARAQLLVLALYFGVDQQNSLGHHQPDLAHLDQVRRQLEGRHEIDPEAAAFAALVPEARAILAILEAHTTCDCMVETARDTVAAMETLCSLAPRPQPN